MPPALRWSTVAISRLGIRIAGQVSGFARGFSSSQIQRRAGHKKKPSEDAYAKTQRLRHAAALASRERWKAATDPKEAVSGKPTPFLESFDHPNLLDRPNSTSRPPLNFGLSPDQVQGQLSLSKFLLSPTRPLSVSQRTKKAISLGEEEIPEMVSETAVESETVVETDPKHARATEAMKRITSLELGSSNDRLHWNIKRCIETFGRHNTDKELPVGTGRVPKSTPRIGKDTGSSEVQIAILTAKIRGLSTNLKNKDKANKRNLRTLVHKRQKLLKYLQRRERGGPRWQNLIQTLGLTDASWKGQISI